MMDLLTKMYVEMNDGFKKVNERFDTVETRLDKVENVVTVLEDKFSDTRKALFDSFTQNEVVLARMENKLDDLSAKVDSHDIKIAEIKGSRKRHLK